MKNKTAKQKTSHIIYKYKSIEITKIFSFQPDLYKKTRKEKKEK